MKLISLFNRSVILRKLEKFVIFNEILLHRYFRRITKTKLVLFSLENFSLSILVNERIDTGRDTGRRDTGKGYRQEGYRQDACTTLN
jgi:hypothetical protein